MHVYIVHIVCVDYLYVSVWFDVGTVQRALSCLSRLSRAWCSSNLISVPRPILLESPATLPRASQIKPAVINAFMPIFTPLAVRYIKLSYTLTPWDVLCGLSLLSNLSGPVENGSNLKPQVPLQCLHLAWVSPHVNIN